MKKNLYFSFLMLLSLLCFPLQTRAQSDADSLHSYTMLHPYDVESIKSPTGGRPKNVILMIGDGMGLAQVFTAWTANRGKLYLDNAQCVGLSKTYCTNKLITDSGAGGTALSSGKKTLYHAVGVDMLGQPLPSLIDITHDNGLSTGMVVACRLWDATPGDFCCHNIDRKNKEQIMSNYVDTPADFIFGGGRKMMTQRKDGRNLFVELNEKGVQTPHSWGELEQIQKGRVFAALYPKDVPLPQKRGNLMEKAAMKAISILQNNERGFFMMFEGSQIDDYGHTNSLPLLMEEMHDFDRVIGAVYKWAAANEETLVIVTADHETGGMALLGGDLKRGEVECKFLTHGHSGVMVPVYAFGPGADEFTGIYENTEIFHKIVKLLQLQ